MVKNNFTQRVIQLLNITDSENLLKKNWNILSDKNECLGKRIKSFFSVVLLITTLMQPKEWV